MINSTLIRQQIQTGQLQKKFLFISENIKKKNLFDSQILPIEYADLFSFYLFLTKSMNDFDSFQKILDYLDWRDRLVDVGNPTTTTLSSTGGPGGGGGGGAGGGTGLGGNFSLSNFDYPLGLTSCHIMTLYRHMPDCHYGYDKNKRPVVYFLFGRYDLTELLKIVTKKQIFDYHLWQNDVMNELCYHKTLETSTMISSSTLVMDVSDMTSGNVTPEFLQILNRRGEVNGRYFPYLFDRILIINALSTDTKMIRTLKEFCSLYSPRANVYVTGE
jgi:hypothetical protein